MVWLSGFGCVLVAMLTPTTFSSARPHITRLALQSGQPLPALRVIRLLAVPAAAAVEETAAAPAAAAEETAEEKCTAEEAAEGDMHHSGGAALPSPVDLESDSDNVASPAPA